jgi:hypothetical protein
LDAETGWIQIQGKGLKWPVVKGEDSVARPGRLLLALVHFRACCLASSRRTCQASLQKAEDSKI